MNRFCVAILTAGILVVSCFGASVEWNTFVIDQLDGACNLRYGSESGPLGTTLMFTQARQYGRTTITAFDVGWLLSYTDWVLASPGEVVNSAMFDGSHTYLWKEGVGGGSVTSGTNEKYLYLAFETMVWNVGDEGWQERNTAYGWVALDVDGYGVFMGKSAVDLDGGPMFVGGGSAIPEPSSAVLVLLGLSGLCLRRERHAA